ncbi:MAG: preprotein translocase subunit SecE [Patescibacteria group bacterium]
MRKIFSFLKEARVELSKVIWPTRRRTIRLTAVVIVVTALFGVFMGVADYGLDQGLQAVLDATEGGGAQDAQPLQIPAGGEAPPEGAPPGGEQQGPVQIPVQPTQ